MLGCDHACHKYRQRASVPLLIGPAVTCTINSVAAVLSLDPILFHFNHLAPAAAHYFVTVLRHLGITDL